ncbi:MAG: hypothetical protein BM555_03580 [Crocinitomix sp. MedPE-SWsnd]|nr:MAG: hypothetical protein BM555_03580 [Crocinitomix sp. MedPE-SWsnd]
MKFLILFSALIIQTLSFCQTAPLSVSVMNYEKIALEGEQVIFVNQSSKIQFKGVSNDEGKFKVDLPAGKYDIQLKSIGEAMDYSTLEIPELGPNQFYNEMWMEVMIEEARSFTLSNLNFATNKSDIKTNSFKVLDELVDYLKLKPEVKIRIDGHTDNVGEESANLTLSKNRANSVKKYLISKGISASRLSTKGFGESAPVAENTTENGKAQNRRTEIQIL